jgi:hypothetical protein
MKEIPLSRGLVAMVDDEDFSWLSQWSWVASKGSRGKYYAVRREGPLTILMHREILGEQAGPSTDHKFGDTLDNRRANLRPATQAKNCLNAVKRKNAKSRFKGVSAKRDKWEARFRDERYGVYETQEDAARAYDRAAVAHDPEFALTNFTPDGRERDFTRPGQNAKPPEFASNYVGISLHRRESTWVAKVGGKEIGRSKDEIKAAMIYARAVGSEVPLCRGY